MWINNSKRRIFFDMHLPDWNNTNIANNFEPYKIANIFEKSNVDSVILYAKCQYGNFYYNTKIGHKHSGLKEQDFFNETKKELQKKDIKVIAYYSVSWDEWVGTNHPEWMVKKSDGTSDTDEFRWKTICINSPYRQVVFDHIKEIMSIAKPDGFWIDMTIIGENRCHCKYCNEKFEQKYGFDIPKNKEDENYNTFMQFRYDYIEAFYGELRSIVKGIDKNVLVTNNYWGYPYSTATMGSRAIGAVKHTDFITGEAYTDWTGLNAPSFFSKFLRGVSGGRPYEALIGRFYNTWDYTVKPFEQMAFEAFSAVANGATVTIDDEPYHDGGIDENLYEDIGGIFKQIKEREPYLGGTQLKYAAILHSQQTKDYYNEYGNEVFTRSIAGSFKMLRDLHYPMDFIFDENAHEVEWKDYKIIILPSVAVVTRKIMMKIQQFVESGGTLIMSGPCALYTVEDNRMVQDSNLLNEALGIEAEGIGKYSISYMKFLNKSILKNLNTNRVSLVKGQYVNYKDIEDIDAAIVKPICETTKERFYHNNLPSPYKTTKSPALFSKKIGKGSVICFAQPIFAHYAKQSQLELRKVFKHIIEKTGVQPLVEFKCPNRIDVAVWEKEESIIIHLLNPNPGMSVCCGYMDPFEGAYPRTLEYMDEIIPVHNIKIILHSDSIDSIESVGEKSKLDVVKAGERVEITVAQVDIWETLMVKFKI